MCKEAEALFKYALVLHAPPELVIPECVREARSIAEATSVKEALQRMRYPCEPAHFSDLLRILASSHEPAEEARFLKATAAWFDKGINWLTPAGVLFALNNKLPALQTVLEGIVCFYADCARREQETEQALEAETTLWRSDQERVYETRMD